MLRLYLGKGLGVDVCSWAPEPRAEQGLARASGRLLPSREGSVPSEHREHPRTAGVRTLQGLCHCPPPGRRDKGADLPCSAVTKHCPDITHRTLQPFPSQTSPSSGPPALKGSSTHQPTHSSAAITQRMSQVPSCEKAACHIPGGEECGQNPKQAWGER